MRRSDVARMLLSRSKPIGVTMAMGRPAPGEYMNYVAQRPCVLADLACDVHVHRKVPVEVLIEKNDGTVARFLHTLFPGLNTLPVGRTHLLPGDRVIVRATDEKPPQWGVMVLFTLEVA